MPSSRPAERLADIAQNCGKILRYTAAMTLADYRADERTRDAVERCLQRISEACYKLGPALDALGTDAPWRAARGIGNILRHRYDRVADEEIWASIQRDVPLLLRGAREALARLSPDGKLPSG